jgi:3-oxoadipate enol-lactonase
MRSLAPSVVEPLLGDDPDPAARPLAQECVAAVPEETWRASVLALLGFDRREALDRISVPTLLLSGSKDKNAPAQSMAKMAEQVPGAEYVCLEGAGHLAFAERPAEFDRAVLDFLQRRVMNPETEA